MKLRLSNKKDVSIQKQFSEFLTQMDERQSKQVLGWLLIKLSVILAEQDKAFDSAKIVYDNGKPTEVQVDFKITINEL